MIKTFTQGAFETTASPLDLALDGSGFFVMKGLDDASYYSRFGGFQMDQDGYLVDPSGMQLQGYGVDANGNLLSSLDSLQILRTTYPPQTTTSLSVAANLDSGSEWIDPATTPFDVNDLDGTTNFQTTVTVYDSLGNQRPVTLCFRKTDDLVTGNPWEWYAVIGARRFAERQLGDRRPGHPVVRYQRRPREPVHDHERLQFCRRCGPEPGHCL